jgi:hypothetical protein
LYASHKTQSNQRRKKQRGKALAKRYSAPHPYHLLVSLLSARDENIKENGISPER